MNKKLLATNWVTIVDLCEKELFMEPVGLELQPLFESTFSLIIFSFYQKSFTDKKPEKNKKTHTFMHTSTKKAKERDRIVWKTCPARENRERVCNVNRNSSTGLSGRDKNTQRRVCTYTNTVTSCCLGFQEGSGKQGRRK